MRSRREGAGRAETLETARSVLFTALRVWPLLTIAKRTRCGRGRPAGGGAADPTG
jgi:hypothetical protein